LQAIETPSPADVTPSTPAPSLAPIIKQVDVILEAPAPRKHIKPFKFLPVTLSHESRMKMSTMATRRILVARLNEVGAWREQSRIVARLVSAVCEREDVDARSDPKVTAILEHVCANFKEKYEMLMVWLHREHGLCEPLADSAAGQVVLRPVKKEPAAEPSPMETTGSELVPAAASEPEAEVVWPSRYENCVAVTLEYLEKLTPVEERYPNRIIRELPSVGPAAFAYIKKCCASVDTAQAGLVSLRDMLLTRPACRAAGLQLLLECARSADTALRKNAVLVCTKLYPVRVLLRGYSSS
jgi:hypothetical protein